jgi:hypothetical protein
MPIHVSQAAAASALATWRAGDCRGYVVVVGAAVMTGLEALEPVLEARMLILAG